MVLPLSVDVGQSRLPWANWIVIAATCVVFFETTTAGVFIDDATNDLVLDGVGLGIIGHVLLHAGILHLLVNMLCLWVFGNAVCARIGGLKYLLCYTMFAIGSGLAQVMVSSERAVGASGAINGVVAMFVVLHPTDYVRVGVPGLGQTWEIRAGILVVVWLVADLFGLVSDVGAIAYGAHVGGFAVGFFAAVTLLKADMVPEGPGPTLLDLYWHR